MTNEITREHVMRSERNRSNTRAPRRVGLVVAVAGMSLAAAPARAVTVQHTYPAGWNLVSVPVSPTDPNPASVYDEVATPLRIYDERAGQIVGLGESGLRNVRPGLGHWLLLPSATTVSVTGTEPSRFSEYRTPIARGWNVIASPWLVRVGWEDARVSVTDGVTTKSLSQARAAGWIQAELRAFDTSTGSYVSIPDNLDPAVPLVSWLGYELLSSVDGELVFTAPPPDTVPPIVDIASPAEPSPLPVQWPRDGDEIRVLTPVIGTVYDDNLTSWKLELRHVELDTWVTLAQGTDTIESAFVANLDPTLQLNGVAELKLSAVDSDGRPAQDTELVAFGGDNKLGNFRLTFIDLEVPFAGIPISIRRTYDTRRRNANLDFGYGWQIEVTAAGKYLRNRPMGEDWSFQQTQLECTGTSPNVPHVVEIRFSDREFYRFAFDAVVPAIGSTIPCVAKGKFVQVGGVPARSSTTSTTRPRATRRACRSSRMAVRAGSRKRTTPCPSTTLARYG